MGDKNTIAAVVEETEDGEAVALESGHTALAKAIGYAVLTLACVGATVFIASSTSMPGLPSTTPVWMVLGVCFIGGAVFSAIALVERLFEFADSRAAIRAERRRIQANWVPQVGDVVSYIPCIMPIAGVPIIPAHPAVLAVLDDQRLDLGPTYGIVPRGAVKFFARPKG